MDIAEYIIGNNPFQAFTIIIATITYAIFVFRYLEVVKKRKQRSRETFFDTLTKGIVAGAIESIDDVVNLYKGVLRSSSEEDYRFGLNRWLREYIAYILLIQGKDQEMLICKTKATEFIKANEKSSPYSELPDNERNILKDIIEYLDGGNKDAVKRKVSELSISIQSRYEELFKFQRQNKWSTPLAIVGLILTALFGALSIYQMIRPVELKLSETQIKILSDIQE